jgi:hypothetical protein
VLGYRPSPLWVLHIANGFQELPEQTIIAFVGCSQGNQLKDLWTNDLSNLSQKVSSMDLYSDFYDGWLQTICNWGLAIGILDQQMYQKCSATKLLATLFITDENYTI